jgi:acetyltransferase-like isoleucine patch superfamily enzyme
MVFFRLLKVIFGMIQYRLNSIKYARKLGVKIGDRCIISTYEFGSEPYLIEIGNDTHVSKGVKFINHDGGVWVIRKEIPDFDVFGKIKVGNNVYIGNNSVIMPGVIIGDNCIIGAESLVSKSIPKGSVVAGVPAKYICSVNEYKTKMIEKNFKTKKLNSQEKKNKILSQIEQIGLKKDILKTK